MRNLCAYTGTPCTGTYVCLLPVPGTDCSGLAVLLPPPFPSGSAMQPQRCPSADSACRPPAVRSAGLLWCGAVVSSLCWRRRCCREQPCACTLSFFSERPWDASTWRVLALRASYPGSQSVLLSGTPGHLQQRGACGVLWVVLSPPCSPGSPDTTRHRAFPSCCCPLFLVCDGLCSEAGFQLPPGLQEKV